MSKATDRHITCPDCGLEFTGHYARVRCNPCSKARTKVKTAIACAAWEEKHKEERAAKKREDWIKNREKLKPYRKKKFKEWYDRNSEKQREYSKEWRLQNLEKDKEYKRQYHITKSQNKDWVEAQNKKGREQHQKHRKKRLLKQREYSKNNKEKLNRQCREWYASTASDREWREKERRRNKAYYQKNKEQTYTRYIEYKARKLKAMLPTTDKAKIYALYKECHRVMSQTGELHHVDHMIPLAIGGAHHQDNLRIVSAFENLSKAAKYIPELGGVWANNKLAKLNRKGKTNGNNE